MSTLLFLKTSSLSANRKLKRQMFFLDSKGLMFSSPGNFQKFLLPVEIIFTHLLTTKIGLLLGFYHFAEK